VKRKEKTTPVGVNLMRSQVFYQAVQGYQQFCMHGQRLCGLQEAAQPSASEPVHPDSGNALQQVFARQAIKLLNVHRITSFAL